MLPEDIQDLVIAFLILIILIFVGCTSKPINLSEERYVYENLNVRDEEDVFFLNLLRTNVDGRMISDLIILNENEDKDIERDIEREIEKIVDYYGKSKDEYGLMIKYPNKDPIYFGCRYQIEDKGVKENLPSLNNGLIELSFKFQGGECFISPI